MKKRIDIFHDLLRYMYPHTWRSRKENMRQHHANVNMCLCLHSKRLIVTSVFNELGLSCIIF